MDGTFTYHGPGGKLTPDPTLASPVRTWSSRRAAVAAKLAAFGTHPCRRVVRLPDDWAQQLQSYRFTASASRA